MISSTNIEHHNRYSRNEEIANTITHGIGAILSLVGLIFLLRYSISQEESLKTISYSIYGISLTLLFISSTFYHAVHNQQLKNTFKIIDHCAIYLLIAGTYTPLILVSLNDHTTHNLLIIIWGIAALGIIFKITFGARYKIISLVSYLGMGYISLLIIKPLYHALPLEAIILLASGGLLYSLGVVFYVQSKIPFNHAIWHIFVLVAAACHYVMMWYI